MSKHYRMKAETGYLGRAVFHHPFTVNPDDGKPITRFDFTLPIKKTGMRQVEIWEDGKIIFSNRVFSFGKRIVFKVKPKLLTIGKKYLLKII